MQCFALDSSRKKPSLTFQHRAIATGTQKDSSLMSFSPKDQTMWVFPAPYPELQPFGIQQRFQLTEHAFLLKVVSIFIPNPHLHLKVSNTRMGRDRNEGTFVTTHGIMRCTLQSCHTHHCSPALSDERGLWLAGPALCSPAAAPEAEEDSTSSAIVLFLLCWGHRAGKQKRQLASHGVQQLPVK